jgi:hypothetical protein
MDDRAYWTKELREAEAEFEAATRRSEVDAAAKRLQRAKAELNSLEDGADAETPKRKPTRGRASGAASS